MVLQGKVRKDTSLPLTGEVTAMMTSEINTTRSHYSTGQHRADQSERRAKKPRPSHNY